MACPRFISGHELQIFIPVFGAGLRLSCEGKILLCVKPAQIITQSILFANLPNRHVLNQKFRRSPKRVIPAEIGRIRISIQQDFPKFIRAPSPVNAVNLEERPFNRTGFQFNLVQFFHIPFVIGLTLFLLEKPVFLPRHGDIGHPCSDKSAAGIDSLACVTECQKPFGALQILRNRHLKAAFGGDPDFLIRFNCSKRAAAKRDKYQCKK